MGRLYSGTAHVELIDILAEMNCWPFYNLARWYPSMVKLGSVPWGVGYHLTDDTGLVKTASHMAWPYVRPSLSRFLQCHPADVIVSFYPVTNYALMLAVRQMRLRVPVVIVAVDMVSVHACWFVPGAHSYLVPTEEARERALRWHVPPERVEVVGGMPVRQAFVEAQHLPKPEARARLGLPQEGPLVLMVGGGEGMGPLEAVIRAIAAHRPCAHLVAIAGRNRLLYERLRSLDVPVPLHVEGFVPDIEVWMRAADLLVTKAGPNALSEAFVSGLPVVLYFALRGQEEGNVAYVLENRAGVWAPRPRQAADAVMSLLADPVRRSRMAERARALANPCAAELLGRRIWAACQNVRGVAEERAAFQFLTNSTNARR